MSAAIMVVIAIVVFGIIWLSKNILNGKKTVQVDFAQSVFATLFTQDSEILGFDGKDFDESMEFGRDRLWEETKKFCTAYDELISVGSVEAGDYKIISSALKIVKIAYLMQRVEEVGPIVLSKETRLKGLIAKDEPTDADSSSD